MVVKIESLGNCHFRNSRRRGHYYFILPTLRNKIKMKGAFVTANGQPIAAKLPRTHEFFLLAQGLLPRNVKVTLALVFVAG